MIRYQKLFDLNIFVPFQKKNMVVFVDIVVYTI